MRQAAKYVGGFLMSRAHKGDLTAFNTSAPPPVKPVPVDDQVRAIELCMQIISQDFWMPAANLARRMPRKLPGGASCEPAIDEYCLGYAPPDVLA